MYYIIACIIFFLLSTRTTHGFNMPIYSDLVRGRMYTPQELHRIGLLGHIKTSERGRFKCIDNLTL